MKSPFNFERAKGGARIITRDNKPVKILSWDADEKNPIVGLVEGIAYNWSKTGIPAGIGEGSNVDLCLDLELTEFQRELVKLLTAQKEHTPEQAEQLAVEYSRPLLSAANKELKTLSYWDCWDDIMHDGLNKIIDEWEKKERARNVDGWPDYKSWLYKKLSTLKGMQPS